MGADADARTDGELLAAAREGDLEAFAVFVRRYEARVRAVLSRMLDDARDVEESTQDTFVQAWRHLDRFRGESALFTWLYRIAVNEALMRLRRARPAMVELDEGESQFSETSALAQPEVAAQVDELRSFLLACVRQLPPDDRAPLVLRDIEGFSNQEVAEILDISVPAAKSRIHRARLRIREQLADWEAEQDR
jgi:RNA polymerase sigma-70 factor, ECF subfamily